MAKVDKETVSKAKLPRNMSDALNSRVLDFISLELQYGRSSGVMAFSGALHLNDFLHSAALITDDCWNNVKGLTSATTIVPLGQSVLKTLVEGGVEAYSAARGASANENVAQMRALAAVEAANADSALEG